MEASPNKPFGPARIVALALIALAVSGLAFLHFSHQSSSVSVPAGAHAGQLTMHHCTYNTESGKYAADCGTLVVRENRHDANSRLIALPVTRIKAHSAHPGPPIFRLEGGPGITNMKFANASRFTDNHDVVLVGYRGVDGSSKLQCPEVTSALEHSGDFLGQKSFDSYSNAFRDCATRLRADGVDLAGYSLPQRVDDLEAARQALGYGRIDLLSESAGTRTAMIYAWRYPQSINRSVMVGVNPPGHFVYNTETTDRQIRQFSALCAQDPNCHGKTDDLAATIKDEARNIPDRWAFLPIKKGNVRIASFFGLMDSTSAAGPISAPMTLNSWISASKGDASGLWFQSLMADLVFPKAFVWGDSASVGRTDADTAARLYASKPDGGSILGNPASDFVWAGGQLTGAWPANPDENEYDRVRDSAVPTLMVDGTLDVATAPENATKELLPHLSNGHQVLLPGLGHTTDFWDYQPAASSRLINTYLDTGKVDESLYKFKRVDFSPGGSQGMFAKIVLLVMVVFAALLVLSMLWLPLRAHAGGGFDRKASAALRTLYPLVLGLGGWFAGAIVVLTASLRVPLDGELFAVGTIGVPVGLGIYWAWVNRDQSSRTKTAGLVAALGGALIGAWVGFHVIAGLMAVLTTIVGAAVGANLILLALDITRDRTARQVAAAPARPALTGSPELIG
ncbi:MAG TPA: alpha/beta fold hydrolase [Thermoleophilaceae bacterium]